jgi:hypothetical protein
MGLALIHLDPRSGFLYGRAARIWLWHIERSPVSILRGSDVPAQQRMRQTLSPLWQVVAKIDPGSLPHTATSDPRPRSAGRTLNGMAPLWCVEIISRFAFVLLNHNQKMQLFLFTAAPRAIV